MSLELLPAIEDAGTLTHGTRPGVFVTTPCLDLVMLCILMSLPVVFTAKLLGTARERTTVRARVPLLVFPNGPASQPYPLIGSPTVA